MRAPRLTTIKCNRCGEESPSHSSHCQVCGGGLDPSSASDPSLGFNEITSVTPDGRLREYKLLRQFISNRGRVLTRDKLLSAVWGYNVVPVTRTVDMHIAKLRKKIEVDPEEPRFVVTVHGVGYKFLG